MSALCSTEFADQRSCRNTRSKFSDLSDMAGRHAPRFEAKKRLSREGAPQSAITKEVTLGKPHLGGIPSTQFVAEGRHFRLRNLSPRLISSYHTGFFSAQEDLIDRRSSVINRYSSRHYVLDSCPGRNYLSLREAKKIGVSADHTNIAGGVTERNEEKINRHLSTTGSNPSDRVSSSLHFPMNKKHTQDAGSSWARTNSHSAATHGSLRAGLDSSASLGGSGVFAQ
nr:hypothetical protein Iba_chr10bCG4500 [Ipomoea batatas]